MAAAIFALTVIPGWAHRLDEYLQETLISVGTSRLQAEITLTPGVAVFPLVAAAIDRNADGMISSVEAQAYAARVLRDLSLNIDGRPLTPRLVSLQFPAMAEMREGLGAIRMVVEADVPRGGGNRRVVFENHHLGSIGAYIVNCLAPADPAIRVVAQKRNYTQSQYELDYVQTSLTAAWLPDDRVWLAAAGLLLAARFAFLWRRRAVAA